MLKAAIVLLMLALVASLGSGFYFLMTDQGDKNKRAPFIPWGSGWPWLPACMALIIYGVATGQLGHRNPWDAGPEPQSIPGITP